MRYQVPQFIEVEDKLFGPLTLKQFLYVAGGVGLSFILWNFLPKFLAIILGLPVLLFFLSLAFYEHNGRPFIFTVENAAKFLAGSKLYIWKKEAKKIQDIKKEEDTNVVNQLIVPKLSDSKLKELTWSLDINKKIEKTESANTRDFGLKI